MIRYSYQGVALMWQPEVIVLPGKNSPGIGVSTVCIHLPATGIDFCYHGSSGAKWRPQKLFRSFYSVRFQSRKIQA
ncbi:MAG TPA: hypothetical protein DCR43_06810 [Bacteroidales bacterium]|nr:MAG: hypothetical protein A2X11_16285 [Bacteroidetes bacterium GWE2_42_24]OFY29173.1 MAG: hypothetical protein A2X09_05550 [Bacteroidetes bacterium GWF2_43_11]HAQ65545.1 hypothetical protein [Bacteroidales bacterium]HBZ66848.1 hypothetical protein [Bacteroidales bacterium]